MQISISGGVRCRGHSACTHLVRVRVKVRVRVGLRVRVGGSWRAHRACTHLGAESRGCGVQGVHALWPRPNPLTLTLTLSLTLTLTLTLTHVAAEPSSRATTPVK